MNIPNDPFQGISSSSTGYWHGYGAPKTETKEPEAEKEDQAAETTDDDAVADSDDASDTEQKV